MIDEREDAEKSREIAGVKPTDHATFEEPTGADAVVARTPETITDSGLIPPDDAEAEEATEKDEASA